MFDDAQTLLSQQRISIRENIYEGAALTNAYILMNVLAATIASYGLFVNSPAVVIGAMIVAMLLGPITGVSLALVDSDLKFLGKSLFSLLVGAIVVMLTASLIGYLHTDIPITGEIMARTTPNLMDLMIALAGGAAGAYATVSPRLSVAFVGVAISTALVPPLCAASILFARGEFDLGLGAVLLTFTNMVAIQFASSVVLWCTGFHRLSKTAGLSFLTFITHNFVSIVLLSVLSFVLAATLNKAVSRQVFETSTRYILQQEINASAGSYLVAVRYSGFSKNQPVVNAVVRGPKPPSPEQVAAIEAKLPLASDEIKAELRVRFVLTKIIGRDGPIYEDVEFGTAE